MTNRPKHRQSLFLLCFIGHAHAVYSIYPRVDENGYVDFGFNPKAKRLGHGSVKSNRFYQCTSKIRENNVIEYSFPELRGAEILGVSEKNGLPYLLTTSWNSEKGKMTILCGDDHSSYLCTSFLPSSTSSCKEKGDFCIYARLVDGTRVGFKVMIRGHQLLLPFEEYKQMFETDVCPKVGYHKIAILEGRPSYKICGPFFQYHFQVVQVDHNDDSAEASDIQCTLPKDNDKKWLLHENHGERNSNDEDAITKNSDSILSRRRRLLKSNRHNKDMWIDC